MTCGWLPSRPQQHRQRFRLTGTEIGLGRVCLRLDLYRSIAIAPGVLLTLSVLVWTVCGLEGVPLVYVRLHLDRARLP